ncbi:PREDICTED: uncharacterized protein LOC109214928 isoform X2 [Nicotiana attenuata]|uniref:uncharacterized protein LOC109214928 isoform X2 n=1 Tax=Nicotiana attenuata TaxID=49451 RepID=UPI0009053C42|nr:PREDICTED: uncharacterized protein LOC109214928 isoform X2 [Nicotiana attenuata]
MYKAVTPTFYSKICVMVSLLAPNRCLSIHSNKCVQHFGSQLPPSFSNSRINQVRLATDQLYTVLEGVRRNIVCLEEGTCSCGKFQMDELPCPHAWAVLKNQQLKPGQYCSFYYKKDKLLSTYEFPVNPMPDESLWVIPTEVMEDVVLPPKGRRNAGRPRKERLKPASEKESKRAFSCSVCGQGGHNRKTCRNRPK